MGSDRLTSACCGPKNTIAQATVDAHGGTIHAHSGGRSQGAVFTVELPVAAGQEPA